jgi:predicted outer membrane protein
MLTELKSLSGTGFDEKYSDEMRKVHKKALSLFDEASRSPAIDSDIQNFARSQLPVLRDQMRVAQALPGAELG